MRTILFVILLHVSLFFSTSLALDPGYTQTMNDTLKILTFNIYGAPNSDWPARQKMIIDELVKLQPDLIGFQEIVQTPAPGIGADNRAKIIADSLYYRTGVFYDFVFGYTHFSWNQYDEGISILSRHIILDNGELSLPPGLFNRKVIWCRLLTPAGIVNFFDTHLSHGEQEPTRIAQVASIKTYIDSISTDSVAIVNLLCGDLNSDPDQPPILQLTVPDSNGIVYLDSWGEANPGQPGYTVPSDIPTSRIDYIFLRGGGIAEIINSELVMNQPNANNIYPSDHLGVLSQVQTNIFDLSLNILSPLPGDEVSGQTNISWTLSSSVEPVTIRIFISRDGGEHWWEEWSGQSGSNSYSWNTMLVPDGTWYMVRVAAMGDTSYGLTQTAGTFTVNNPGNAPPEINLLFPRGGEHLNETNLIRWEGADADGDSLTYNLDFSIDDGATWSTLVMNFQNDSTYSWNTLEFPNSPYYRVRLRCTDGIFEVADTSGVFEVLNPHWPLPDSLISHVGGKSDAIVKAVIVDQAQLTGHTYRITFDDTLHGYKTYNVHDVNTGVKVVQNATQLNGTTEGPIFDDLRLLIKDFDPPIVNQDSSRWIIGSSTLDISIFLPNVIIGGTTHQGVPYSADYKITVFDHIVDTSSIAFGAPAIPMMFTVQNETNNRRAEIVYFDPDNNRTISRSDVIYILEPDIQGNPQFVWAIGFSGSTNTIPPQPSDMYILKTFKTLTHQDVYELNSTVAIQRTLDDKQIPDYALYQNYPNPFNPTTIIEFALRSSGFVTLKIYNILGEEVATLVSKKLTAGRYKYEWDASSVASGVYLYTIQAGNYIEAKKMVILH